MKHPDRTQAPDTRRPALEPSGAPFEGVSLPEGIKWFRAAVPFGHAGAGNAHERILILCAPDMVSALDILKAMPGWKRSRGPETISRIKDPKEIEEILRTIDATPEVTLPRVLKDGFYYMTRLRPK